MAGRQRMSECRSASDNYLLPGLCSTCWLWHFLQPILKWPQREDSIMHKTYIDQLWLVTVREACWLLSVTTLQYVDCRCKCLQP